MKNLVKWFKNENPIIQLQIVVTIVIFIVKILF